MSLRTPRLLLIALFCSPLASCVGVVAASAASVGFVKYHQNETTRDYDQDLEHSWLAALEAMQQLGYGEPLSKDLGPLEAAAEYEDSADRVRLSLESRATGGTRLTVRVGKFDNKTHRRKALVILEEVSGILDCDDDLRAWTEKVRELSETAPDGGAAKTPQAAER